MDVKDKIHSILIKNASVSNRNGYVDRIEDNLLPDIDEKYYKNDLLNGSGKELESKFKALWSSSALVVNNFVPLIKNIENFSFFEYTNFIKYGFERKFSTGLKDTPPSLDFYIENDDTLIAFESKFLETLTLKEVKFSEKYYTIDFLNSNWINLIEKYNNEKHYLDIAQLIKHSIGLTNYKMKNNKKVILVYIYWVPINEDDINELKYHKDELNIFLSEIKLLNEIEFISITYKEFWQKYSENECFINHIKNIKHKYLFEIK